MHMAKAALCDGRTDIGRGPDGRLKKGHGNGGRPPRAVEQDYLRRLTIAVSPDDWTAICTKAKEQALEGDHRARDFLASYLMGSPTGRALLLVAAAELAGLSPLEREVAELADEKSFPDLLVSIGNAPTAALARAKRRDLEERENIETLNVDELP
jgi:hypothetical protein